jgi:hypothetical protein
MFSLFASYCALTYLILLADDDLPIFYSVYLAYKESLSPFSSDGSARKMAAYNRVFKQADFSFPPSNWVALEILKLFSAMSAAIVTTVTVETLVFAKYQFLLSVPKEWQADIDTDVRK